MGHVLILGGSGMLSGVALQLLADGHLVAVVGRSRGPLQRMVVRAGAAADRLVTLRLDYYDIPRLRGWIAHEQLMQGPIETVIAWVTPPADEVLQAVAAEVNEYQAAVGWTLLHVLGSRAAREHQDPVLTGPCRYRTVTLGFIREGTGVRWLSNQEIAQGVYLALAATGPYIVGQVEPWQERPQ
ncbi:MAG: short-chain dehydrogenase [Thermaerobacter sp.]|nr:short-chain dehydrogenase [Thermaerobacter sp.]